MAERLNFDGLSDNLDARLQLIVKLNPLTPKQIIDKAYSPAGRYRFLLEYAEGNGVLTPGLASTLADVVFLASQPNCPVDIQELKQERQIQAGIINDQLAQQFCIIKYEGGERDEIKTRRILTKFLREKGLMKRRKPKKMKIDVITLFPKMFESPFDESIIKRAIKNNILDLKIHNLRDWAIDDYGSVDDKPFGGDVGMLIRPEPVYNALKEILGQNPSQTLPLTGQGLEKTKTRIILMSARGERFNQAKAEELSKLEHLVILAGHYEGFDQRISDYMVDEEISIGDYVLTGGELPAMVVIDSVSRLIDGVLGKDESNKTESWSETEIDGQKIRTVEYPQYTRPREFMGKTVPEVLLSGDPKKIKQWQLEQVKKTIK